MTERVGEAASRSCCARTCRAAAARPCAAPPGRSTLVPSASCDAASIARAVVDRAPAADAVEVLERQPDRIHQLVAAGAGRVAAVLLHAVAHRRALPGVSSSGGTLSGGAGGGVPRMFVSTYLPRSHRRRPVVVRGQRQDAAVARAGRAARRRSPGRGGTACRRRSGCRSAAPAARSRTCSRRRAASMTLLSSSTMLSNSISVSRCNASRRLWSKSGKTSASGCSARARCAGTATVRRSCCAEGARALVLQHAADLLLEHRPGSAGARRSAAASSSSSGMLLQRKNDRRDASSRSVIR